MRNNRRELLVELCNPKLLRFAQVLYRTAVEGVQLASAQITATTQRGNTRMQNKLVMPHFLYR